MTWSQLGCSDESIFAFVQGRLPAESVSDLEEHLSICADCRSVLAETARFFSGSELHATVKMEPADLGRIESASSSEPPGLLAPGTRVARYVLSGVIGSGAAGVVYRAYDPELRREIALKLLRAPMRDSASLKTRLLREAQAMAQLSHPNVVSVYDVGTYGSQVFIVLELVKGKNLAEWLDERPRSWQEIRWAFVEAGKGLAAAHAVQLVHRDFKPANVLLGSDGRVRVTDFGLARSIELGDARAWQAQAPATIASETPFSSLFSITTTQAGLAGTPVYMAPEQFAQERTDDRTDQFGFCVALYLALYKRHPFLDFEGPSRRYSLAELAREVSSGSLHGPPTSAVPSWMFELLRRGLQVDPDARFPSMDELLARLSADPEPQTRRPRRRVRGWATATAFLLVAVGVLTLGLRAHLAPASTPAEGLAAVAIPSAPPPQNVLTSARSVADVVDVPPPAQSSPPPQTRSGAHPKVARPLAAQRASGVRVAPAGRKQYSDGLKEPF